MQNAPVRFTISDGDGLLSLDGVQGWSPSVTVRSDSFWDRMQGIPRRVAQVYLRHGSVPGEQSTITALAQAGDQTVTLQTTATVASPDLAPPTDFTATPLAEDTVLLAWVPGIVTEPTTIQISRDLGVSWETHTVVAAGIAELLIQNLIPDREVSFRAFTAGTPTAASRFTSTFRAATAATSDPTPNATATPVTSPQLSSNVDSLWNAFNQNDPRAANWSFSVGYFYQKNSILDQKIPFARNRNIFGLPKASYHWKVNAKRGQVLNWLEVAQPWPNLYNIRPHFVRAMSWVDTTGASRTPDYLIEPDIHSPGGPYLWTQTYLALVPVEVNCPELYMFGGHKNDVVELCKVSGIICRWRLKDATPVIGTFDHPTDLACSFTATTKGKNTIQLVIGGNVVWEKPTEILHITTRASWGAVAAKVHTEVIPDIQHITLHHTSNTGTGWSEMQRIQKLHMSLFPYNLSFSGGKNFNDIGYHLIVDKNGDVFEGRQIEGAPGKIDGPYAKGEHVGSNNTVAGFGLCTMGDYDASEGNESWPATRQKAVEKVISAVCRRHKLTKDKISYHKAMALPASPSLCPGSNYIPTIPDIIKHVEENLR